MQKWISLAAILFNMHAAFADTPPARAVNSETFDATGNGITSHLNGGSRGLDEYNVNPVSAPVNAQIIWGGSSIDPRQVNSTQAGTWTVLSHTQDGGGTSITSTISGPRTGLDVNVIASPAVSGTVTANQGVPNSIANGWPVKVTDGVNTVAINGAGALIVNASTYVQPVSQSGTWTTGRTWTLSNSTDSIASVQSGTWTVQQGSTPTSLANAWPVKITDGINPVVVKGASAAPTVADNSLVVAISPNSPITVTSVPPTDINVTGNITAACPTGSACPAGSTVQVVTAGFTTIGFETHGTWTATLTQDVSFDPTCATTPATALWYQTASVDTNTNQSFYVTSWGNALNNNPWVMNVAGGQCARIRAVSFVSGTINVTLDSGVGPSTIWAVDVGNVANGTTDSGNPIKIGGVYRSVPPTLSDGQRGDIQVDSSARLIIRPLTVSDVVSAVQSGAWTTGRTWTLSNGSDSISAVQSGTWNINNISGTVSLPTNAAQEAGGHLASIDSKLSTLGQKPSASSVPVVLALDQTVIPVSQSGTWTVQQGTPPWSVVGNVSSGAPDSGNPVKIGGVFNTSFPSLTNGQRGDIQLDSSSRLVVAPLTNTSVVKAQLQDNSGSAIVLGQTTMASSLPVVIASNQSAVPVGQSGAWSVGRTWTLASGTDSVSAVQSGTWAVNASQSGTWSTRIQDTAGNGITSQASSAQRALDVGIDVAGVQIDPRTRTWALSSSTDSIASVQSGTWTVTANAGTGTFANNVAQFGGTNVSTGTGASGTGIPRVTVSNDSNILATQSGTWNINNISGTISLPTGAATNSAVTGLQVTQGSTTSGQSGTLVQGAVTTSSPSYTTAQTSPLSLTTAGALRVDASATTQPISGTVTANQGGTWNVNASQSGTWTVQPGNTANTTPWLINVGQFGGSNIVTGTGAGGTGIPRVTVSNDSNILATQSGTWTVQQGSAPWSVSQSGTWTTGRTWTLASGTDSVAAVQSGTWTVQQGSAPWSNNITQVGGSAVTLGQKTSANSFPIVVASDQSNLPVSATADASTSGTMTNVNDTVVLSSMHGLDSALFQLTGTWAGTVLAEASIDGTNWTTVSTAPIPGGTFVTTGATANGLYRGASVGAYTSYRLRFSVATSGTVSAAINASSAPSTVQAFQFNAANLNVSNPNLEIAPGASSTGIIGPMVQGLVNTSNPSGFANSTIRPVSLNANLQLRVIASAEGATASAVPANAIQVGGSDGTNLRAWAMDTSGNGFVVGSIANGSADSGNPVKVGGVYNSTQTALTTGNRGNAQVDIFGDVAIGNNTSFSHLTANATTTIKSGNTLLYSICVNNLVGGATLTVYNNTAGSGTVFAVINSVLNGASQGWTPHCTQYGGVLLGTGLTVVAAGGPSDYTIIYK